MSIMTNDTSSLCPACGGRFAHDVLCPAFVYGTTTPTFERLADATLARCRTVYAQRGTSYGDTWLAPAWLTASAVAGKLGIRIDARAMRALALAVLVDIKHERMRGGYSDDSIVDGINYAAVLAEEMQELGKKGT